MGKGEYGEDDRLGGGAGGDGENLLHAREGRRDISCLKKSKINRGGEERDR